MAAKRVTPQWLRIRLHRARYASYPGVRAWYWLLLKVQRVIGDPRLHH